MSALDNEYCDWLAKNNITRVPTQDDVNAFLAERNLPEKIKQDKQLWLSRHPRFQDTEKNWKLMEYWLDLSNLPALYENLDEAFDGLLPTGNIALHPPPVPPPDPNKPETRIGNWKNGRFEPDPNYNQPPSQVTYAQHAEPPNKVGQRDPGGVAAGEPTVRKSVNNMTSSEYLKAINTNRKFQKEMDES